MANNGRMGDAVAGALLMTLQSANELDSNLEEANAVDGLFAVARAIERLAAAIENTQKGVSGNGNGKGEAGGSAGRGRKIGVYDRLP